jgi:hypothetical protein
MPAWAQAAAALLIFASGAMTGIGVAERSASPASTTATMSAPAPAGATIAPASVSPDDLTALEDRLREQITSLQNATSTQPAQVGMSEERLLQRVRQLVAESEQRQQRELAFRTAQVIRDLDSQRQVDLARIERTVGQMEGTTGAEVMQQRQMLNYLLRVSQRSPQ